MDNLVKVYSTYNEVDLQLMMNLLTNNRNNLCETRPR